MTTADVTAKNEKVLRQVARAIHLSQGQFCLMRLRCDCHRLRLEWPERLWQFCQTEYDLSVPIFELESTDDRLYAQIKAFVDGLPEVPNGVQVVGFEVLQDRETVFSTANSIREVLRASFSFPLLFWLDEASVIQLMESANDLYSWSTGKRFLSIGQVLRESIPAKAEGLLCQLLVADDAELVGLVPLLAEAEGQELYRIDPALAETGEPLPPDVEAGLALVVGRWAYEQGDWAEARRQWERSLALRSSQAVVKPEGRCGVLFQLGLVALKRAEELMAVGEMAVADEALGKAETLFQESVRGWQGAGQPEIAERFRACNVVKLLSVWRRGQEVLNRVGWVDDENLTEPVGQTGSNDAYGEAVESLAPLVEMESLGFPQLKLRGLAQLRRLYFRRGEYGRAFQVRQAQEAEEWMVGLRAFIGVGRIVADLADKGIVRPIELQILGTQVQAQNIRTLADYEALGDTPKQTLVQGYFQEVVMACGPEHEKLADLVLYALTDEWGTRPLRTKPDLLGEVRIVAQKSGWDGEMLQEKLELVLEIFTASRLVALLPAQPLDQYQLVHDYLSAFIRATRATQLQAMIAQLEETAAERDALAEQNQILTAAQRKANRRLVLATSMIIVILAVGLIAGFVVMAWVA